MNNLLALAVIFLFVLSLISWIDSSIPYYDSESNDDPA